VGNKRLPFYHNDENRRRQVQVLVASVGEVVEAYATQQGSAGAGVADTSASEVYMSVPDTARVEGGREGGYVINKRVQQTCFNIPTLTRDFHPPATLTLPRLSLVTGPGP
jgi:hypothetical protein